MKQLVPVYDTVTSTLSNTWPMLTLFIVIMTVLKLSRVFINNDKFVFYKEFYNLLFIIYILLLYYLLLGTENASSGMNFTPFKEITRYPLGSTQFFYNVKDSTTYLYATVDMEHLDDRRISVDLYSMDEYLKRAQLGNVDLYTDTKIQAMISYDTLVKFLNSGSFHRYEVDSWNNRENNIGH